MFLAIGGTTADIGARRPDPSGRLPSEMAVTNCSYVHPLRPVASGVRFRAGGQLGSPPTIGPPLKSGPWQPVQTLARCLPNSAEASSAGGRTGWVVFAASESAAYFN